MNYVFPLGLIYYTERLTPGVWGAFVLPMAVYLKKQKNKNNVFLSTRLLKLRQSCKIVYTYRLN